MRTGALRRALQDAADQILDDDLLRLDSLSEVERAANGQRYDAKEQAQAARLRVVDFAMSLARPGLDQSTRALFWKQDARGRTYCDSQELLLFARELEHVMTQVEREEFADLRMANGEILPINTSVPEGARTYTYYILGSVGVAKFMAGYASGNLPTVDVRRVRMTGQIEPYSTSYRWTTQEIRESQFAGMGLESELALAARRAVDQLINDSGLFGRPELGLPGLLTHPNINRSSAPLDSDTVSSAWDEKTPDEILADVNSLITTIDEITFGKEKCNLVLLARAAWNTLATRRMGEGTDGTSPTILDHLETLWGKSRNGRPPISFEVLDELTAANSQGHLSSDAMFAMPRGDKRKAELIVPMLFRQHAPQQNGLEYRVPVEGTTGGVKMTRPLAFHLMDGIGSVS